ncbi:MAG TPA: hypothetical protein VGD04_00680 [Methylophilus sp.]
MFKFKKWLWTQFTALRGADRAYADYLAHFNHYQQHVTDKTLQQDLQVQPMSKPDFLKVWLKKPNKPAPKSGCCS